MIERRVRNVVALIGWAAFLAAAVAALHLAGRGTLAPPPLDMEGLRSWVAARQPVEAAAALLRVGALGLGWYLLAVTVLGTVTRVVRLAPLIAAVDKLTIPGVRSMLAAAAGVSLSVAAAAPAAAGPRTPVMHRVPAPTAPPAASTTTTIPPTTTTTTTTEPAPTSEAAGPSAGPEPPHTDPSISAEPDVISDPDVIADPNGVAPLPPAPEPSAVAPVVAAPGGSPTTWTVALGDNLWRIAESVLERSSGQAPSPAAVVPYWRSLIEANRSRLRDPADPGLIFAGQVLALPHPPAA